MKVRSLLLTNHVKFCIFKRPAKWIHQRKLNKALSRQMHESGNVWRPRETEMKKRNVDTADDILNCTKGTLTKWTKKLSMWRNSDFNCIFQVMLAIFTSTNVNGSFAKTRCISFSHNLGGTRSKLYPERRTTYKLSISCLKLKHKKWKVGKFEGWKVTL